MRIEDSASYTFQQRNNTVPILSPRLNCFLACPIIEEYGTMDLVIALIRVTQGKVSTIFSNTALASLPELPQNREMATLSKTGLAVYLILKKEHLQAFGLAGTISEGDALFSHLETEEVPHVRQSLEALGFTVLEWGNPKYQECSVSSANEPLVPPHVQAA